MSTLLITMSVKKKPNFAGLLANVLQYTHHIFTFLTHYAFNELYRCPAVGSSLSKIAAKIDTQHCFPIASKLALCKIPIPVD
jgi:hypothetical protein